MPVYSVGTCTARGLRALLAELGARPGGPAHVVVSDLREELVLYVNGRPYLRRELEMPAAALHHAGDSTHTSSTDASTISRCMLNPTAPVCKLRESVSCECQRRLCL